MRPKNRYRPCLEGLEQRNVPASFNSQGFGPNLVLTQVAASVGALTITDDGAGTITIDDVGAPPPFTMTTSGFSNLTINLLSTDTVPVTYDLTGVRSGNLTLCVNNSLARTLTYDGGFAVGGNLYIKAGTGALTIAANGMMVNNNLTVSGGNGGVTFNETTSPLVVANNATFNGGNALDTLNLGIAGTTVGGNLILNKFNIATTSTGDTIGGSLMFNDVGEALVNTLTLTDSTIGNDLFYVGGNRGDVINLAGTTPTVGRNVNVNFGTQFTADTSTLSQAAGATSLIGGSVFVTGGNLGTETVTLAGAVGGSVIANLGGGTNTMIVTGLFSGPSFSYIGGAGVDTITYSPLAGSTRAHFTAFLGASNDSVTFGNPATNPLFAFIDFGAGADTVLGLINFPHTFLNLP